ncbi:MAG: small multi-drug export protein [Planctomycetes bacterium]|nr:small multi-drug export protein [Planctomycetota bacterium]
MEEKTEQPANETNSKQKNHLKETLLTSSEGRILLVGVTLAFLYTLWLGIKLIYSPEESQILFGMTATDIIFGRAAAMAFGYSLELGHAMVITVCIMIETILVLIFYPLFVFSWQHLLVIKWLRNMLDRLHRSAETHKDKVQRYGIIGLFVFVWLPFWMTGPVVGCVIGFLLGLKARLNIPIVLAGTYVAIFGWAFFLRRIHSQVASYSSYAPMVFFVLLIVIIILGNLLHRTGHENKNKT